MKTISKELLQDIEDIKAAQTRFCESVYNFIKENINEDDEIEFYTPLGIDDGDETMFSVVKRGNGVLYATTRENDEYWEKEVRYNLRVIEPVYRNYRTYLDIADALQRDFTPYGRENYLEIEHGGNGFYHITNK